MLGLCAGLAVLAFGFLEVARPAGRPDGQARAEFTGVVDSFDENGTAVLLCVTDGAHRVCGGGAPRPDHAGLADGDCVALDAERPDPMDLRRAASAECRDIESVRRRVLSNAG